MTRPIRSGDVVHYVLNIGPNKGAHRPAMVVSVTNAYTVNLQVFTDGTKSQGDCGPNVFYKPQAIQDEGGKTPGTWHRIEDENEGGQAG